MAGTGGSAAPVDVSVDTRSVTAVAVLLAGPVIMSLHFLVVYLVVEAGCTGDGAGLDAFDPPVPAVVTLAATVAAAVACLLTAWWGWARWRASGRSDGSGEEGRLLDRGPIGLVGLLLSLLGLVTVLAVGLPALVLDACA